MSEVTPKGRYKADIVSATFDTSSKSGTPQLSIDLDVYNEGKPTGFIRTTRMFLTDKTLGTDAKPGFVKRTLAALDFNNDMASPAFGKGVGIEVECRHEDYNGKTQEKWEIMSPRESRPIPEDIKRQLAQRLGPVKKPTPVSTPATPPKPSAPQRPSTSTPGYANSDEAWAALCKTHAAVDTETLGSSFWRTVEDYEKAKGKTQDAFTPAEWGEVVSNTTPF